jgi:hypothetical protein
MAKAKGSSTTRKISFGKRKAEKLKKLITNTIVVKKTIVDKVDNYE